MERRLLEDDPLAGDIQPVHGSSLSLTMLLQRLPENFSSEKKTTSSELPVEHLKPGVYPYSHTGKAETIPM